MRRLQLNILAVAMAAFTLTVAPRWVNAQSLVPATHQSTSSQGEPEPSRVVETEPGYRLQLMAVDLSSVAIMMGGLAVKSPGIAFLGSFATYVVGPSVLHSSHGRDDAAGSSILLRLGLPMVGFAISSYAARDCDSGCDEGGLFGGSDPCQFDRAALGGLLGLAGALFVDYYKLAGPREVEKTPARVSNKPALSGLALVPSDNGGSMLLSGRF